MKKLLIKLAAGVFLTALSFMQAAACPTLSITVSPTSTGINSLCAGTVVTISGTYGGTFTGMGYNVQLLVGGIPGVVQTLTGTSSSFHFTYVLPDDGTGQKTIHCVVPKHDDYTCSSISNNVFPNITLLEQIQLSTDGTAGNCYIAGGYDLQLSGSDMPNTNIAYYLYRSGTYLTSMTGDGFGDVVDFGNQVIPGTYSIVGINTVSGCTRLEGQTTYNWTVYTLPGIPTLTYTFCGSGGLTLYGATTSTGVNYNWYDLTGNVQGLFTPSWFIATPTNYHIYNLTVTSTLTGCSSAGLSITGASRPVPTATLLVNGGYTASVCLPSSALGISITFSSSGTTNVTANISQNGVPGYVIVTSVPGFYTYNTYMAVTTTGNTTTTGNDIYTAKISDSYCSSSVSVPLTITASKMPSLTSTQTADCPSCSPQTRSYNATTDIVSFIQWRYPFDAHWGSLQGTTIQPISLPGIGYVYSTVVGTAMGYNFTYSSHGIEYWPVTATNNGCTVTVTSSVVPCATGCTGRIEFDDEEPTNSSTILYPNPASGELNITAPYDNYGLYIHNILGSEVLFRQLSSSAVKIDVSALPAGTYTVKLVGPDGQINKKLEVIK